MDKYTTFCTAEQTRRAHKLDAPIEISSATKDFNLDENHLAFLETDPEDSNLRNVLTIPTTQQMVGWLREKGVIVHTFACEYAKHYHGETDVIEDGFAACIYGDDKDDYNQAELAAIDAALDFLEGKL